jgi:hypothetical protein
MSGEPNINDFNIQNLAQQLKTLANQAIPLYTQKVEDIINNKIQDHNHIELTFDYLLDYCYDDEMLLLYKKLARYYFKINPVGTANYINYYRERYEDE